MRYFLVLSLAVVGQLAALADMGAIVKGDRVNIRKEPSITSDIVGQAEKDSKLVALERHEIKSTRKDEPLSWIKVRIPSEGVWVKSDYLDDKNQVKANLLNVRQTPQADGKVMGHLKAGEQVTPLEVKDGWTRIEGPEKFGFIAETFITLTDKVEAPVVKAAPAVAPEAKKEASVAAEVKVVPAESKKVEPPTPAPEPVEEVNEPAEEVQVSEAEGAKVAPVVEDVPPVKSEPPAAAPKAIVPISTNNTAPEEGQPTQEVQPVQSVSAPAEASERIVRREGVVRPTGSIAAATPYGLYSIQNRRLLNYLYVTNSDLSLKKYSGKKVQVTGPESIDSRWPNQPVLTVKTLELLNRAK